MTTNGIVVNIAGDDINKMIAQAILDSTLGSAIQEGVKKAVNDIDGRSYSYDSQVQRSVRGAVEVEMSKILRDEYGETIRQAIRAQLEKHLAPDGGLVDKVIGKILSAND